MWTKRLFWIGVVLAGVAAVASVTALDTNAMGHSTGAHPGGALALAAAAFVFVFASSRVPPST